MEDRAKTEWDTWSAPQCPATIEYSRRVLDDIRLAVVDAFDSLPHGGAEIGGILLGQHEGGRLIIADHVGFDCEHAFGPSFTLSDADQGRLADLLAQTRQNVEGRQPVGWYHSHTRSGIFLSDADLAVHNRYFPEPWQVALVVRPQIGMPTRAGFFFLERDGSIHRTGSHREFVLEPLPLQPVPAVGPPAPETIVPPWRREREPQGPVIDISPQQPEPASASLSALSGQASAPSGQQPEPPAPASLSAVVPEPAPAPEVVEPAPDLPSGLRDQAGEPQQPEPAPASLSAVVPEPAPAPEVVEPVRDLPSELSVRQPAAQEAGTEAQPVSLVAPAPKPAPPRPERSRWKPLLAIAAALAVVLAGFATRQSWLPRLMPAAIAPAPPPPIGLNAIDSDGQLQIRWNRDSPAVRRGAHAVLEITDGAPPQVFRLDAPSLQAGAFTYPRHGEKVDVRLTVHGPGGQQVREATSFLGAVPERKPAGNVEAGKPPEDLAERNAKALEQKKKDEQEKLRKEQRRRLRNQNPDR